MIEYIKNVYKMLNDVYMIALFQCSLNFLLGERFFLLVFMLFIFRLSIDQ